MFSEVAGHATTSRPAAPTGPGLIDFAGPAKQYGRRGEERV